MGKGPLYYFSINTYQNGMSSPQGHNTCITGVLNVLLSFNVLKLCTLYNFNFMSIFIICSKPKPRKTFCKDETWKKHKSLVASLLHSPWDGSTFPILHRREFSIDLSVLVTGWLQSRGVTAARLVRPWQVYRWHGSTQLSAVKLVMEKQMSVARSDLAQPKVPVEKQH